MPSLPNSTPKCRKFSHRGFAGHIAITFYTNNEKKRHRMSHARQTWDMPNITDGTYYYCFSIKSFNKFYILFNSISPFFPSIFPYDSVFFHFFLFALFVFKLQHFFFCSLGRVPEKSLQFISLPHDFLFRLVRLPIVIPLLLVLKGGWIIRNHFTHLPK